MKTIRDNFLLFIVAIMLGAGLLVSCKSNTNTFESQIENKTYYIDFPEEIELVSENKSEPDTLVCYMSSDSLIFRYIISERYYKTINE